jgi:hypothetical protein
VRQSQVLRDPAPENPNQDRQRNFTIETRPGATRARLVGQRLNNLDRQSIYEALNELDWVRTDLEVVNNLRNEQPDWYQDLENTFELLRDYNRFLREFLDENQNIVKYIQRG